MVQIWLLLVGLVWLLVVAWLWRREQGQLPAAQRWGDVAAGGVLFLLALGFFWRILSGDVFQPADGGDLVSFLFPTYRFAAGEVAQGRLPLWNPTLYGGAPLIGDIQAGFLYLPNLLLFLVAPRFDYPAMQWLAVLHLYWAGLGLYVLLRTLRLDGAPPARLAALFGALAFMYSDALLIHLGNLNLVAVLSWLPWVLAAYVRALAGPSWRWVAIAALLFGLSTYAGHAQSSLYVGLALGLYTAGWVAGGRWRAAQAAWWQPWAMLLGAAFTAGLLAAPVLMPAAELAGYSVRSDFTYQEAVAYSLAPTQALVGLVTPGFFGRGPALHWSLWERVELPYVGVAALLLALLGLIFAAPAVRRHLWIWGGIALFGLLVSLGVYGILHGLLTRLLPMFDQLRAPARALILWALGVSVLAAAGVDGILRQAPVEGRTTAYLAQRRTASAILLGGAVVLGAVAVPLAYFALLITQQDATAFLRASLAALALVFAAAFWLATWAILAGRRAGAYGALACAVLLTGLLYFDLAATGAYTDISSTDPTQGFQHPEIVDFLRADPDLFRIDTRTGIEHLWQPDTAALVGLQDVGGVANPLALRSARDFWDSIGGRAMRRYDWLNVKYVLVAKGEPMPEGKFVPAFGPVDGLEVYRNTTFVPRAWVAPAGIDLAAIEPPAKPGGATVRDRGSSTLQIDVQAPEAGYLVLSEFWYPGWQATVDGISQPVWQANGALRAVAVPGGQSTVVLRFAPSSWRLGLAAFGVGLLLLFMISLTRNFVRRSG